MAVDEKEQQRFENMTKKPCVHCGQEKSIKDDYYRSTDELCIDCCEKQEDSTKQLIKTAKSKVKSLTKCYDFEATEKEKSTKEDKYIEVTLKFKVPYVDMPDFSGYAGLQRK